MLNTYLTASIVTWINPENNHMFDHSTYQKIQINKLKKQYKQQIKQQQQYKTAQLSQKIQSSGFIFRHQQSYQCIFIKQDKLQKFKKNKEYNLYQPFVFIKQSQSKKGAFKIKNDKEKNQEQLFLIIPSLDYTQAIEKLKQKTKYMKIKLKNALESKNINQQINKSKFFSEINSTNSTYNIQSKRQLPLKNQQQEQHQIESFQFNQNQHMQIFESDIIQTGKFQITVQTIFTSKHNFNHYDNRMKNTKQYQFDNDFKIIRKIQKDDRNRKNNGRLNRIYDNDKKKIKNNSNSLINRRIQQKTQYQSQQTYQSHNINLISQSKKQSSQHQQQQQKQQQKYQQQYQQQQQNYNPSDQQQAQQCKYCLSKTIYDNNPLINICNCQGGNKFTHQKCLVRWIKERSGFILDQKKCLAFGNSKGFQCQICKGKYSPNIILELMVKHYNSLSNVNVDTDFKQEYQEFLKGVQVQQQFKEFIVLKFQTKPDKEILYFLNLSNSEKNYFTIGRNNENDIVVYDLSTSRKHCILEIDKIQKRVFLFDLKSKFGTLVKVGKQNKRSQIYGGNQIYKIEANRQKNQKNQKEEKKQQELKEEKEEKATLDPVIKFQKGRTVIEIQIKKKTGFFSSLSNFAGFFCSPVVQDIPPDKKRKR